MKNDIAYRLRDVFFAILGLILLAPVFLIIGILIKRDSPGPVFYIGPRIGLHGNNFHIFKFRTMWANTPKTGTAPLSTAEDPRVTPFGRWLRKTKLNELPQLVNVLLGEMSIVGPRPESMELLQHLDEGDRAELLSVLPGITSPASLIFRDEEKILRFPNLVETYVESIQPSKLRLDLLYVRNRSFWIDLNIVYWTILLLIPSLKIEDPAERQLFFGPLARLGHRVLNWTTIDFVIVYIAFTISGLIFRGIGPIDVGRKYFFLLSLGFSFLFALIGSILGMHKIYWSKASPFDMFELSLSSLFATGVAVSINHYMAFVPDPIIFLAGVIAYMGFFVTRYRNQIQSLILRRASTSVFGSNEFAERVLILGAGEAGQFAAWMLRNSKQSARFHVLGYIDDDFTKTGIRIEGVKVIGTSQSIPQVVKEHDIGVIVLAIHRISAKDERRLEELCRKTGARIVQVPNIIAEMSLTDDAQSELPHDILKLDSLFDLIARQIEEAQKYARSEDYARSFDKLGEIQALITKMLDQKVDKVDIDDPIQTK